MWKTGTKSSIKPVIARDTTCSVSLLTATTGGSNFAIPSNEIPPHGNGVGFEESSKQKRRSGAKPEVTWPRPRQTRGARAFCIREFGSVSPAPATLNPVVRASLQDFRIADCRKPEADNQCGGRSPTLPGARQKLKALRRFCTTCPSGRVRELPFSDGGSRIGEFLRSPEWRV
jgi:hypothetical protein